MGVIHRDLKAENIFYVSSTQIKVGDFGFSTQSQAKQLLDTFCGSPPYAAPELFCEASYQGHLVDLWAMGVVLYYMVSGTLPFRGDTIPKLREKILEGKFTIPNGSSPVCQELIVGLLTGDPEDRFTMEEVYSSLWLRTNSTAQSLGVDPITWKDIENCGTTMKVPTKDQTQSLMPSSFSERDSGDFIDVELLQVVKDLGIPTSNVHDFVGEPRNPTAGTYRILLHRKHLEQFEKETSEENVSCKEEEATVRSRKNSRARKNSGMNGQPLGAAREQYGAGTNQDEKDVHRQQKSKFCVIL